MALTTSLTTLASKPTPRNGFGGASAVWPALSSSRITPANPDASAKAPWTRTTVGPGMRSPQVGEMTPTTLRHRTRASRPGCAAPGVGIVTGMDGPGGWWLLAHGTPLTPQVWDGATGHPRRYGPAWAALAGLLSWADPPLPPGWNKHPRLPAQDLRVLPGYRRGPRARGRAQHGQLSHARHAGPPSPVAAAFAECPTWSSSPRPR